MRRSADGRPSVAEPEIWFRIVYVALDAVDGTPVYREQTVEIELEWPPAWISNSRL